MECFRPILSACRFASALAFLPRRRLQHGGLTQVGRTLSTRARGVPARVVQLDRLSIQHTVSRRSYTSASQLQSPASSTEDGDMAAKQPEEGSTLSATFQVQASDLASATSDDPSDSYAKVLATPRLVSFMEVVCGRMLVPFQRPDQLSVGTRVEMDHLAATPEGEMIEVTAKFIRKEGKQFLFETVITDAGGEIGRGKCNRAIIDEKRLLSGANKRVGKEGKM